MKFSPKSLLVAGGGLVLLGLAAAGWNSHLEQKPTELEPKPRLPNPNAYDTLAKVGKLLADGPELNILVKREPLAQATMKTSLAKKQALYERNGEAIALIKLALQQAYFSPPATSTEDPGFFDQNMTVRRAGQLLVLEGQIHETNGDHLMAAQSYLDAMQLGTDTMRGRAIIGMLVGISIHKLARHNLYAVCPRLSLQQTQQALQRLKLIATQNHAYADTLRSEKAFGQMATLEMMHKPGWRFQRPEEKERDPEDYPPLTLSAKIQLWLFSQRAIMAEHNAFMDALIAQTRQDFSLRKDVPLPRNPASHRWAFNFANMHKQSWVSALTNRINNDFLLIAFALHAYKLEHKELPITLSQLLPRYLSKVPTDAFAPSQELRYQRNGREYLLYSIGPDGTDDGGQPIDKKEDGNLRHIPRYDSQGDIVAGINE